MMSKNSERGFAAIEAVLIIIILAIIGFTGWYVWHSKQNADKVLSTPTSNTTPNTETSSSEAYVEVIQADGTIKTMVPTQIAKTAAQKGILEAIKKTCKAPDNFVIVNYQVFDPSQGITTQDGGYAHTNSSCGGKATNVSELAGSGSAIFLHQISGTTTWIVDDKTQQGVVCSAVDGKGYPATVVSQCLDNDTVRAPKS